MRQPTVGIVDYGVGNLASVCHALHALDLRCRVSHDQKVLDATDLLLLPGVGAFPTAIDALNQLHLRDYICEWAHAGRPVVGICLGMQLLAEASSENRPTPGLGLIPGQVRALADNAWHIGWNEISPVRDDPLFNCSPGTFVYFNHSYVMDTTSEHRLFVASATEPVTAVIRRDNVIGLQFHPEKSQQVGRALLNRVIRGLCRA